MGHSDTDEAEDAAADLKSPVFDFQEMCSFAACTATWSSTRPNVLKPKFGMSVKGAVTQAW